ncbi:MAG: ATP-dependent Clp protease adaptor ClpS [Lachnospiraceae bacterium]|nr:ATP-dependent Clp protease adaptor ClpS [Lachnospiraceae bacterium]
MEPQSAVRERTEDEVREPKRYRVVMLNDDFTTMDFVVEILIDLFQKDPATAKAIMMDVHKKGRGIVGSYPYDIARTKTDQALSRARAEGYPFQMEVEEE